MGRGFFNGGFSRSCAFEGADFGRPAAGSVGAAAGTFFELWPPFFVDAGEGGGVFSFRASRDSFSGSLAADANPFAPFRKRSIRLGFVTGAALEDLASSRGGGMRDPGILRSADFTRASNRSSEDPRLRNSCRMRPNGSVARADGSAEALASPGALPSVNTCVAARGRGAVRRVSCRGGGSTRVIMNYGGKRRDSIRGARGMRRHAPRWAGSGRI